MQYCALINNGDVSKFINELVETGIYPPTRDNSFDFVQQILKNKESKNELFLILESDKVFALHKFLAAIVDLEVECKDLLSTEKIYENRFDILHYSSIAMKKFDVHGQLHMFHSAFRLEQLIGPGYAYAYGRGKSPYVVQREAEQFNNADQAYRKPIELNKFHEPLGSQSQSGIQGLDLNDSRPFLYKGRKIYIAAAVDCVYHFSEYQESGALSSINMIRHRLGLLDLSIQEIQNLIPMLIDYFNLESAHLTDSRKRDIAASVKSVLSNMFKSGEFQEILKSTDESKIFDNLVIKLSEAVLREGRENIK